MGRTIIQPIGPLYGEAVNGTVFGRPNGSIYVPSQNSISANTDAGYVRNASNWFNNNMLVNNLGNNQHLYVVAESQDNASYVQLRLSDDSDFTTYAKRTFSAGTFNIDVFGLIADTDKLTITSGTTYYLKAVLVAASGVDVATSDVIELEGFEA